MGNSIRFRIAYIRSLVLLLGKGRIAIIILPLIVKGAIELYDLAYQFVPDPTKLPRVYEVLPQLAWQSWVLIALIPVAVVAFETTYRLHRDTMQKLTKASRDDVSEAITKLQSSTIASSDVTAYKVFHLFSSELAIGMQYRRVPWILEKHFGKVCDWHRAEPHNVMSAMVFAGVVDVHTVQAPGHDGGMYPTEVYKLLSLE